MRTHNRSENGRSAIVALCAHPTHIDIYLFAVHLTTIFSVTKII